MDDARKTNVPGTLELARRQAAAYGLYFEVVRRELGGLLDHIDERRMFPSSTAPLIADGPSRRHRSPAITCYEPDPDDVFDVEVLAMDPGPFPPGQPPPGQQ